MQMQKKSRNEANPEDLEKMYEKLINKFAKNADNS